MGLTFMANNFSSGSHIHFLDGWRGTAILGVFFAHYIAGSPINLGRFGVELFFVLSGRLMAGLLFEKEVPLSTFYLRRMSRVIPALAVFLSTIFAATLLVPSLGVDAKSFASAMTLTINYYSLFSDIPEALDHIWSLCVEEHMYVLLGGIALISRSRGWPPLPIIAPLASAFIVNGFALTWAGQDYYAVYWRSDVRGASILLGALAYLAVRGPASVWAASSRNAGNICFGSGVVAFALNFSVVPDVIKYSAGTILLATCLALLKTGPAFVRTTLEMRWLTTIGLASFSLYLWQQPFKMPSDMSMRLLLLPVGVILALVSFRYVEAPARLYLNSLADRRISSSRTTR